MIRGRFTCFLASHSFLKPEYDQIWVVMHGIVVVIYLFAAIGEQVTGEKGVVPNGNLNPFLK